MRDFNTPGCHGGDRSGERTGIAFQDMVSCGQDRVAEGYVSNLLAGAKPLSDRFITIFLDGHSLV